MRTAESTVTKAARARQIAERPAVVKPEPRDDGPLLRAALNASYAMAYGSDGRPTEDPEKIRSRFAEFLGVDVASIGHSERRLPCSGCRGLRSVNVRERGFVRRRETCSTCKGEGIGAFEFVQLPDEPRDGKATSPRQRLEFFMVAPDITKLPKAPDRKKTTCGANVDRAGTFLVCALPRCHRAPRHNTAADGSGDAWDAT